MLICLLAVELQMENAESQPRLRIGGGWIRDQFADDHRHGQTAHEVPPHLHAPTLTNYGSSSNTSARLARASMCRFCARSGRVIVWSCVELNIGQVGNGPVFL